MSVGRLAPSSRPPLGVAVTAGLTLLGATALGSLVVGSGAAVVATLGGLVLAAAVRVYERADTVGRLAGGLLAVPGLALTATGAGLVVVVALRSDAVVALAALALPWAGLAGGVVGADGFGDGALARAGRRVLPGLALLVALALLAGPLAGGAVGGLLGFLVDVAGAVVYATGLLGVPVFALQVAAASGLLSRLLGSRLIADLAPPGPARDRLRDRAATARRPLTVLLYGSLVAVLLLPVLVGLAGGFGALRASLPGRGVAWLLEARPVRTALVAVAAGSLLALAVPGRVDGAGADRYRRWAMLATGVAAGAALTVAVAVAAGVVRALVRVDAAAEALGVTPPLSATAAAAVGAALLAVALVAGLALLVLTVLPVALEAIPPRVAGPAMAGTALFGLALLVAVETGRALPTLAGGALAVAVWDVGEFGATLRAEVGSARRPRVELVHAGGTVAVGLLAVAGGAILTAGIRLVAVREATLAAGIALLLALAAGVAVLFSIDG